MEPLDEYGLLGEPKAAPESIDDIFSDDQFGDLLGEKTNQTFFEFKHTPRDLERAEADFVAQRKPVKDFSICTHVQGGSARIARGEAQKSFHSNRKIFNLGIISSITESCFSLNR